MDTVRKSLTSVKSLLVPTEIVLVTEYPKVTVTLVGKPLVT